MANEKITELTELTTVADADLLAVVDDPAGTPATKKITRANLMGDAVDGPATSTDNAIARYDGTGGDTLQDSGPLVDDTGNLSMEGGEIQDFTEEIVTANTGASYEIDWATATLFELTLTDSPTFTFSNLAAGKSITLILIQDATGSRTVTWPASVDWPSATAPTLSSGANDVDVITLFVRNDGSTVLGFEAGLDMG